MNLFPMHSWHPMVVHFPLVALLLAAVFDAIASTRQAARWREAATLLWWIGFGGAAVATTAVLLIAAAWRWRLPYSRAAAGLGIVGALGLGAVGYLGGEMVYRHALGIPTDLLRQVRGERIGFDNEDMKPSTTPLDSMTHQMPGDSAMPGAKKPHTHAPGEEHD
jgi:uncharacterized membrane protein